MKYRIEYFNLDGSQLQIGDDFAFSLFRLFNSLEDAKAFRNSLGDEVKFILLQSNDGVAWEGI